MINFKEILITINDWSVVRWDKGISNRVYGEHRTGCTQDKKPNVAHWCWEYDDKHEECWVCGAKVPEEIVGLVRLYHWGKPQ